MAAVDITGKVSVLQLQRLAMHGKPTDDYSATPATITITFVITPNNDPLSPTSVTVDYAET